LLTRTLIAAVCLAAAMPALAAKHDPAAPVRAFINEAWNAGDFSHMEAAFAPHGFLHFRGRDIPLDEKSGMDVVKRWRAAFPDFHFQIEDLVAQGDTVAVRLTFTGTMTGAFNGDQPTGKHMSVSEQIFCHVKDGRITDIWEDYDELGMRRQLGILHG
jgi:predicted ester cyclase